MKKIGFYLFIISLLTITAGNCQPKNDYPFDLETLANLSRFTTKETIMPVGKNGRFHYINRKTKQKLFSKEFDIAYPFVGTAALVKFKGKYGVINKKGNFLVQPIYNGFRMDQLNPSTVVFSVPQASVDDEEKSVVINLWNGSMEDNRIICAEPANIKLTIMKENNKYGVKDLVEPVYDSIYLAYQSFIVAKKDNKIGVVTTENKILQPFEYDDIVCVKAISSIYPFGLKKDDNWFYFDNPRSAPITVSQYKCLTLGKISQSALGMYQIGDKYNVLLKNGNSFPKSYDWISENGRIAINDGKVYLLSEIGEEFLYY